MKKEHFLDYAHRHVGFRQTEGKGFIDFSRKQESGESYQGVVRVSFEGRFVQFTWLKDEGECANWRREGDAQPSPWIASALPWRARLPRACALSNMRG